MKRAAILTIVFLFISFPVLAETTNFNDIPSDHWASKSVYDLVKMGITQGYPDGTFRGDQKITRYETAVLLVKLAESIGPRTTADVAKLRAEVTALKAEIAAMSKTTQEQPVFPISGSFRMEGKMGNLISNQAEDYTPKKGPIADYRLKTTFSKELNDTTSFKINLDTMDTGFYGDEDQNLATKLLDFEGLLKMDWGMENPVNLKITAGPGPVAHVDATGVLTAESTADLPLIYARPRNAIELSTTIGGFDLSGGYIARTMQAGNTGEIDINHLTTTIGYTFENVPMLGMFRFSGTADYLAQDPLAETAGPKDLRGKIKASAAFTPRVHAAGIVGAGKSGNEGLYIGAEFSLADVWDTGTIITLKAHKFGTEYFSTDVGLAAAEFDMEGLDVFNRPFKEGTAIIDGEIAQIISNKVTLKGKGDIRLSKDYKYGEDEPDSSMMVEGGISYDVSPNATIDALYRVFHQPAKVDDATSDMAAVGLMYKF